MKFSSPLLFGRLIRRRIRFLADIELESGEQIVAHCPNSGSMKGVLVSGARVAVSRAVNPKAKLGFIWELIFLDGNWVGINTQLPNRVTREALEQRQIPVFRRVTTITPEAWIADDTRIDFALGQRQDHWLEVKNVTLVENGIARFPDSVTKRGQKHLRHLIKHVQAGGKSTMLYFVQHHAAVIFEPADEIDPEYGRLLRTAVEVGVGVQVWKAHVSPQEITLSEPLAYRLP